MRGYSLGFEQVSKLLTILSDMQINQSLSQANTLYFEIIVIIMQCVLTRLGNKLKSYLK